MPLRACCGSRSRSEDRPRRATGLRRIRDYSLPKEWRRLQENHGQTSFIGKILILEREALPERGVVVLIRDGVGF
ncbi:hypothetical protein GCM10014715_72380 [Streptomyces spiralis]|uniref:Uncharacterized protein n=1 Tax=Streptomyces spiralis TaxID=66376 RepID=A0A919AIJ6_9ACTN|nr:hypothetical protein GCM10014715_72380 [Streptomyces spiralis]